ncbi:MAG: aerobic carbon-monoxide dehydrogenase large subunit [Solirubrobacteraceae bacterium]|jgi:carbon-monoxide dehydrogenase large subunit|nr:aerobic carbon-monoxide dehydrogenase large subunit [Solirubrobacteraceae bacterium]
MASAYRAVYLRVHPTGKCVLSLSTEGAGQEQALAEIVSDELGIPVSDTKVVAQDLDRWGQGHGYVTTSSPTGTANAVRKTCAKIKEKSQILAGGMLGTSPQSLSWDGARFYAGRDPLSGKRIEEIALYSHGGALELPAGLEGSLDAQTTYRD